MSDPYSASLGNSNSTGPRRGRRTEVHNGQIIVEWDTGGSTLIAPRTPSRGQRTAAVAINTFHSLNLFPKTLVVTESPIVQLGKVKTLALLVLMPLVSVAILTWYMLTPLFQSFTLISPGYLDYVSIEKYSASCSCINQNLELRDIVTFALPDETNTSTNVCKPIMALSLEPAVANVLNFTFIKDTTAGNLLDLYYRIMLGVCWDITTASMNMLSNVLQTTLTEQLLTRSAFTQMVYQTASTEAQKYVITTSGVGASLGMASHLHVPSFLDPSGGAADQTPANCSCGITTSHMAVTCSFRIAFDVRNNLTSYPWSCSHYANAFFFDTKLLTEPDFYQQLLLQGPYDSLVNFTGQGQGFAVDIDHSYYALFVDSIQTQFNRSLLTFEYEDYYNACQPLTCDYAYRATPSLVSAFTLAIGIISGVQSFLMVVIDRTFDFLCSTGENSSSNSCCSARARKSAQSEEHAVQLKVLNPVAT